MVDGFPKGTVHPKIKKQNKTKQKKHYFFSLPVVPFIHHVLFGVGCQFLKITTWLSAKYGAKK